MASTFDWRRVWVSLTRADPLSGVRGHSKETEVTAWPSEPFISEWSSLKADVFASQRDRREVITNDELTRRLSALKSEAEEANPTSREQANRLARCLHHIEEALEEASRTS